MKMFVDISEIYLHKAPVDFRKGINGLSLIVEQHMNLNPFSEALFVFCNRSRDKLRRLKVALDSHRGGGDRQPLGD